MNPTVEPGGVMLVAGPMIMDNPTHDDPRWQAVLSRDRAFDGHFVFGVVTTGIFCRPSCPARRPKRRNVRIYAATADAERAGLRACLRCRPLATDSGHDARDLSTIRRVCTTIEAQGTSGEPLTTADLAQQAGLEVSRLRRLFVSIVGVTPRQYVEAVRFGTLKATLRDGTPVTDAIYEAGFGNPSQVYTHADERLGMTPGRYRAGGREVDVSYVVASTPVGPVLAAGTARGLCAVMLGEDADTLVQRLTRELPQARLHPISERPSDDLRTWLDALCAHLEGRRPHLDLPRDVRATAFQELVWRYLRTIPRGETRSYSDVARAIGRPRAVRAVASACAANPTALVVPCHRVLRANGELGGYRWGVERKQRLLDRERSVESA